MKKTQRSQKNGSRYSAEAGFSLLLALISVLFIGLVAAVLMNLMRIRYAILAFVVAVVIAIVISALPDIKRYARISSM